MGTVSKENIRLYNSLTKRIESLRTKEPQVVRVYHCGPTVYKRQHVGNMRRYLFADFLHRSLEFLGYRVHEIMNITDVGHLTQDDADAGEDKIEQEARKRKMDPTAIANEQIAAWKQDLQDLNIRPADTYPRATDHIPQMIVLIEQLLKKQHAYTTSSGVYYDVQSFPDYGKLSGNTLEKLEAGARVAVREEKRHPGDFLLWRINDADHLQQWDSPWGRGYPGWHVECSAMAREYLGGDIDIHTGGEDNMFPHHENEIAQSEGAFSEPFVRVWMHNRHLRLKGKKLAKREGEQITLGTLRDKGFSPLAFRLMVFGSNYRHPLDFSWEAMAAAEKNLETMRQLIRQLLERGTETHTGEPDSAVLEQFGQALADDLNTPSGLGVVMEFVHRANTDLNERTSEIWATLQRLDTVLGVFEPLQRELTQEKIPADIVQLAAQREQARKDGDWERADTLRQEIAAKGFIVEDTPQGPRMKKQ